MKRTRPFIVSSTSQDELEKKTKEHIMKAENSNFEVESIQLIIIEFEGELKFYNQVTMSKHIKV